MAISDDGHRILQEAKANVERLKDSEQRFEAAREALFRETVERITRSNDHSESRNERHRREIDEQAERFDRERRQTRREEQRHKIADWSDWDRWADGRIEAALAEERVQVCTAIGDEVRKAIEQIYEDIAADVKDLRAEITTLKATLDKSISDLREIIRSENAKVIESTKPAAEETRAAEPAWQRYQ